MDLTGTWKVSVEDGPRWFRALNLLRDRKIITCDTGYNIARGFKWGRFTITRENDRFVFTYSGSPIVDSVYVLNDKLIGFFYLKGKYVGQFKMTRIL